MLIHAFEERGLGKAPFSYVQEIDSGSIKAGHTCDFCGTAIRYIEVIRSADGKTFKVGCECVRKTGDKGLIDTVKRESRRQRAQVKYEIQREAAERELAAQRERNNGLTDWEAKEAARIKVEEERLALITAENQWIINLIEPKTANSDWAKSMAYLLKKQPLTQFSEQNRSIFADIYARQFGRANSQAYSNAYREAAERIKTNAQA